MISDLFVARANAVQQNHPPRHFAFHVLESVVFQHRLEFETVYHARIDSVAVLFLAGGVEKTVACGHQHGVGVERLSAVGFQRKAIVSWLAVSHLRVGQNIDILIFDVREHLLQHLIGGALVGEKIVHQPQMAAQFTLFFD